MMIDEKEVYCIRDIAVPTEYIYIHSSQYSTVYNLVDARASQTARVCETQVTARLRASQRLRDASLTRASQTRLLANELYETCELCLSSLANEPFARLGRPPVS